MDEQTRRRRHQVYKLIMDANMDSAFGRTWDVEKFIDGIEKIYHPDQDVIEGSDGRRYRTQDVYEGGMPVTTIITGPA